MAVKNAKFMKLRGANMDIDLTTDQNKTDWKQEKCPWNKRKNT